jgi:hypothetical protein
MSRRRVAQYGVMDANSYPTRRAMFTGLGGLAAGAVGARYLGRTTTAEAATCGPPPPSPSLLVPQGGAWFGAYPGPDNAAPWAYEAMTGRKLDVVKRYEALDGAWPSPADRALIAEGRWLNVCWSSRLRSGGVASWADVAAGRYDAQITAQARRLASIGPVWVGYDNEMDGVVRIGASGPLPHYLPAFHRIQGIVKPIAPNVLWVWCPTGNNHTAAVIDCYPGDKNVDWIGYDPYDATLRKGGPLETYRPFPAWLASQGIGLGKPLGVLETGFHRDRDNVEAAAAWVNAVPAALSQLGIKMWLWFNSSGGLGDTSLAPATQAASALKNIAAVHMLKQPHVR